MAHTTEPLISLTRDEAEKIAFNLCSLHDFPPDFVQSQQRFALAVLTEYLRMQPAIPADPVSPFSDAAVIKRLRLEPGDAVVLHEPERLNRAQADRASAVMRQFLDTAGGVASKVPVLVLDGGRNLSLLSMKPSEITSITAPTDPVFPAEAGELDLGEGPKP